MTEIVIIGSGFAGIYALKTLLRHVPSDVRVTMLTRSCSFLYYPLLQETVAERRLISHVDIPLPIHDGGRWRILREAVQTIELGTKQVRTEGGTHPYDYLICATGTETNWFATPGAREHAHNLRSSRDGQGIYEAIVALNPSDNPRAPRRTVTIVGGGATGVEATCTIADALSVAGVRNIALRLVNAAPRLLAALPERMGAIARTEIQNKGVEVLLGQRVVAVGPTSITLSGPSGTNDLPSDLTLWLSGVTGTTIPSIPALPTVANGRILVQETLQVADFPEVQVIGDQAAVCEGDRCIHPQTAQVAVQQGKHAARNILRMLAGNTARPYRFLNKGTIIALGRNHAVMTTLGVTFGGILPHLAWRIQHWQLLSRLQHFINTLRRETCDAGTSASKTSEPKATH